jgi:poly(hydroxyalkanoate) depolymerase family esterase
MLKFGQMPGMHGAGGAAASRLMPFEFAPNPGNLGAKKFMPPHLPARAPLVVVLHGCTQTPEGYDRGSAWTKLAARSGFAVIFPEQLRTNNPNGCFNWFEPGDMRRGQGEPASIKAMIDQAVADHDLDPSRIYITGLSAGAAMAGVMLATYPETFAGGGLIAGLPYGVATSMPAALSRMRSRGRESDAQLADLVRHASAHVGPWPPISVWHGTADATVNAGNADASVAQWLGVHGLTAVVPVEDKRNGHPHRAWHDASGQLRVEEYQLTGMGHGTPLDTAIAENGESAGAFLLDVGLSSTQGLALAWGLIDQATMADIAADPDDVPPAFTDRSWGSRLVEVNIDVQKTIEDALRSAGLMR